MALLDKHPPQPTVPGSIRKLFLGLCYILKQMPLSIGLDTAPSCMTHWSQLNRSHPVLPLLANCLPQLAVESPITKCLPTQLTHPENRLEFLASEEVWRWK